MQKKIIFLLFLIFSKPIFSQSTEGYWDNVRATTETILLAPRERIYIKTQEFPVGTTEVVYRITVLDDNQKISSSLVSVLKSIPDPTGISQGSAGAVFLLSTISGDDKCKYGIYTSELAVKKYVENSKIDGACFFQNKAINKEAKLLSANAKCNIEKNTNLYFAFTSDNWIMKQKIILEVVPWINLKASKGWNLKAKQEVLGILKKQAIFKNINKKDSFSALFLDELTQKQSYTDFKILIDIEKNNLIEKTLKIVLVKTGEIKFVIAAIRQQATANFENNKIDQAITLIQEEIIEKGYANATDYIALGRYYLFSKQFEKALQSLKKAAELDNAQITIQLNLAHIYLFTDKINEAKKIHKKYKSQNINASKSWIEQTNEDFKLFEEKGFSTENFKKIKSIFND